MVGTELVCSQPFPANGIFWWCFCPFGALTPLPCPPHPSSAHPRLARQRIHRPSAAALPHLGPSHLASAPRDLLPHLASFFPLPPFNPWNCCSPALCRGCSDLLDSSSSPLPPAPRAAAKAPRRAITNGKFLERNVMCWEALPHFTWEKRSRLAAGRRKTLFVLQILSPAGETLPEFNILTAPGCLKH